MTRRTEGPPPLPSNSGRTSLVFDPIYSFSKHLWTLSHGVRRTRESEKPKRQPFPRPVAGILPGAPQRAVLMASSLGMLSCESPSALRSVTERPGPTGSEPSAGRACTALVPSRDLVGAAAGRAGHEGKDPGFLAHNVSHLWGGDGTAARVPGASVTAAALTRDRAGEAVSRRPRPHTVLMGPDYSTGCGGNSELIRHEKRGALGIRQHHPTTAELGTPRPASPLEGSRTSRVGPHPPHHTPGVPSSGGGSGASSCAWGLPEDFPDWARPRAPAACPSGGFQ
uniref:Uncharacterized protein n=1 Tax=Mustela putorius furo TaxID=9669 RepID=M3Z8W4_MUSPF